MENAWFHDYITPDIVQLHSIKEVVYSGRTQYQFVQVIDTRSFGRCLVLDGKVQSAEADEYIYHEALVHPAMVSHPRPEKVLIAGGGEGATLREVLKYRQVKKAIMVDIDREVIDICRHYLTSFHQGSFDDSRVELHIADIREYLDRTQHQFDVIVLDLPEPIENGPAVTLHTREFYGLIATRLARQGTLVLQAGSSTWGNCECFTAIINTLEAVFPSVFPYTMHVPSYGSMWGFAIASQESMLLAGDEIDNRIRSRLNKNLRFYDGVTHQCLFSLPKNLREAVNLETRVITEQSPLFVYKR